MSLSAHSLLGRGSVLMRSSKSSTAVLEDGARVAVASCTGNWLSHCDWDGRRRAPPRTGAAARAQLPHPPWPPPVLSVRGAARVAAAEQSLDPGAHPAGTGRSPTTRSSPGSRSRRHCPRTPAAARTWRNWRQGIPRQRRPPKRRSSASSAPTPSSARKVPRGGRRKARAPRASASSSAAALGHGSCRSGSPRRPGAAGRLEPPAVKCC